MFFVFKQRKNKVEISEGLEEFEKVCYTLLSSIVSCIPSHGYLMAPFCIDLRTAVFIFSLQLLFGMRIALQNTF